MNRRKFLYTASGLLPLSSVMGSALLNKDQKLSFSTLGCPDWEFRDIVSFAAKHHFEGLEIRGIKREIDLTKSSVFNSSAAIKVAKQLVHDNGLEIVNLGTSTSLHHLPSEERTRNINEAKRYIDLAAQLGCPHVRVFPNNLPKDDTRNKIIELIIQGLKELAAYAKGTGVSVLLESHGDVVWKDDLERIMNAVNDKQVQLIWDITNMWTVTREAPEDVYAKLKPYIQHVHIKDAKLNSTKLDYVLLGEGDTSIMQALDLLVTSNYNGYYSFEWEKLWHPEIAEPEIAIAHFARVMRERW